MVKLDLFYKIMLQGMLKSTKSKIFTVIKCYFTAITCHDNEKFYYHDNVNIYHYDYHTFSIIAQHYYVAISLLCVANTSLTAFIKTVIEISY